MRKGILLGAIVLVGAGLAILPYFTGIKVEERLNSIVEDSNEWTNLNLKRTNYQRGWFHSKADLALDITRPAREFNLIGNIVKMPKKQFAFALQEKITHGPVILHRDKVGVGLAYIQSELNLKPQQRENLAPYLADKQQVPKVKLATLLQFDKGSTNALTVPGFSLKGLAGADSEFNWKGLTLEQQQSGDKKHTTANLRFDGVSANGLNNTQLIVSPLSANLATHENVDDQWALDFTFNFPGFTLRRGESQEIRLDTLTMQMQGAVVKNELNWVSNGRIKAVKAFSENYGPLEYKINLSRLDAKAFMRIKALMERANEAKSTDFSRRKAAFNAMMQIPALLSRGPLLALEKLDIVLPAGEIYVSGALDMPKSEGNTNPMSLWQSARAFLNLEVPKVVAQQILSNVHAYRLQKAQEDSEEGKNMKNKAIHTQAVMKAKAELKQWVEAGTLIDDGKRYTMSFKLQEGKMSFNNQLIQKSN